MRTLFSSLLLFGACAAPGSRVPDDFTGPAFRAAHTADVGDLDTVDGYLGSLGSVVGQREATAGSPAVLHTASGPVVLLIDSRLLADELAAEDAIARAFGIRLDGGRSFMPVRIEAWRDGDWRTMDLPASGTAGSAVLGGDR